MDNAQLDALMKSITSQIESAVNDAMQKDIPKVASKILREEIKVTGYRSYKPKKYQRTYDIYKTENIKVKHFKGGFSITNETIQDSKDVFSIWESGQGWSKEGEWSKPRPILENATDKINQVIQQEMVDALKARGLNARKG